jgi:hypothetical protein
LQNSEIVLRHIGRDDIRMRPGQSAVVDRSGNAALASKVETPSRPNEFLQAMVVAALSANGRKHASILEAKLDWVRAITCSSDAGLSRTQTECQNVVRNSSAGNEDFATPSLTFQATTAPSWQLSGTE